MLRPVTTEEFISVNLATRGERYNHRRWPREVVEAFLAAKVVTGREVNQKEGATASRLGMLIGLSWPARAARDVSCVAADACE